MYPNGHGLKQGKGQGQDYHMGLPPGCSTAHYTLSVSLSVSLSRACPKSICAGMLCCVAVRRCVALRRQRNKLR